MRSAVLADLLDLCDSGVWGNEEPASGMSVLRSTNFRNDGTLNFENLALRAIEPAKRVSKLLSRGDLLLEKSGGGPSQPVGRVVLFNGDGLPHTFGNFIARLRPKSLVVSEYLWYYLRYFHSLGKTRHYQKQTTGIRNLEFKRYLSIQVPLRQLDEQRCIVDLLARAEGIVRLRREAQQKAAELIPAIFIDMFGDPATNPKGWQMSAIEELCPVQTGATPRKEVRLYYEGGTVPWIRTGEVRGLHIRDAAERITELAVRDTNCKVFPVNTVLVAMYGQGQTRGRTGMLMTPAATNQACAAILPSDKINAMFLFEVVKLQYERLRAMGRGGNQANLNLGMIKAFQVPRPPMEAQLRFVERVTALESIQRQQAAAARMSLATFDALLARAFA